MKKSLLFMAALSAATFCASAQDAPAAGEYYIRNVKTGFYLNNGYSWGTKAILKPQARVFQLEENGAADGTVYLKSSLGVLARDNATSGELYCDKPESDLGQFYLEKQDNGYYTIDLNGWYLCAENPDQMMSYNPSTDSWESYQNVPHYYDFYPLTGTDNYSADDMNIMWELLTREQMHQAMAAATDANVLDATYLIKAHMIDVNDKDNETAWLVGGETNKLTFPAPGWGTGYEDSWIRKVVYAWFNLDDHPEMEGIMDVNVCQQVADAPAGTYEVEYQVSNQSLTPMEIMFNTTVAEPIAGKGQDYWYGDAASDFNNYDNLKKAVFTVGDDGKLAITMTKHTSADTQTRFAFKSFILKYHGTNSSLGGVESIEADAFDADAPAEYYNLQGIRVAEPTTGLYIVRQGSKVSKQLIRK